MVSITKGYNISCKNNLGGVKYIYLFPFVKYPRSLIEFTDNLLDVFPTTIIYKFEFVGVPSLDISQEENDGGKFYNNSISFELQGLQDAFTVQKLSKKDYRCIVEMNNGNKRILGLFNGLYLDKLSSNTGSGKSDLNGFSLSFKGEEIKEPLFINNLNDAGFTVNQDIETFFRITQSGDFRTIQNNDNRIIQNG